MDTLIRGRNDYAVSMKKGLRSSLFFESPDEDWSRLLLLD